MPHFDSSRVVQHVVFRLADSLPIEVLTQLDEELRTVPEELRDVERRKRIEDAIDRGYGSCLLREPTAARLVEDALLHFDRDRYRLHAWVVMPNHVHVLLQTLGPRTLARIVGSWKSFTGRRLGLEVPPGPPGPPRSSVALGSPGSSPAPRRIWHREYCDRFIRDQRHFLVAREYIHDNPVKAGLVVRAEDWPWSSAGKSRAGARRSQGPG